MPSTLTLICDPRQPILQPDILELARRALDRAGVESDGVDWLSQRVACDIPLAVDIGLGAVDHTVRDALAAVPVDVAIQPSQGRRKRLLVADMESTIIENEMLEELADLLGLRAPVAEITRRAMNGELDFEAALAERVALLKDLPAAALDEAGRRIRIMPGAATLVGTMQSHGALAALVSGGFRHYTAFVAASLGFDMERGNTLGIADGRLTGRTVPPVLGADAKLQALHELADGAGCSLVESLAVGDGANDLPMLGAAGLGVSFRGKPAVAAAAPFRLTHADLTGVLFLQGYRRDEFSD